MYQTPRPSLYFYSMKKIAMDKKVALGPAIAAVRNKKGMTQRELAEKMEVSQRVISYYENPTTNLSIDVLTKIAKALDVPRKKLLDMDEEITEEPGPIRALQKKLSLVPKFPAADQQYIAKMIDMLAVKNGLKQSS